MTVKLTDKRIRRLIKKMLLKENAGLYVDTELVNVDWRCWTTEKRSKAVFKIAGENKKYNIKFKAINVCPFDIDPLTGVTWSDIQKNRKAYIKKVKQEFLKKHGKFIPQPQNFNLPANKKERKPSAKAYRKRMGYLCIGSGPADKNSEDYKDWKRQCETAARYDRLYGAGKTNYSKKEVPEKLELSPSSIAKQISNMVPAEPENATNQTLPPAAPKIKSRPKVRRKGYVNARSVSKPKPKPKPKSITPPTRPSTGNESNPKQLVMYDNSAINRVKKFIYNSTNDLKLAYIDESPGTVDKKHGYAFPLTKDHKVYQVNLATGQKRLLDIKKPKDKATKERLAIAFPKMIERNLKRFHSAIWNKYTSSMSESMLIENTLKFEALPVKQFNSGYDHKLGKYRVGNISALDNLYIDKLGRPVKHGGKISRKHGKHSRGHLGIDLFGRQGDDVFAVIDGFIDYAEYEPGAGGNVIRIATNAPVAKVGDPSYISLGHTSLGADKNFQAYKKKIIKKRRMKDPDYATVKINSETKKLHQKYLRTYNTPFIYPKDTKFVRYAHLDSIDIQSGRLARAGEKIGTLGNTGSARKTMPHIHFSIYGTGGEPIYSPEGKTSLIHRVKGKFRDHWEPFNSLKPYMKKAEKRNVMTRAIRKAKEKYGSGYFGPIPDVDGNSMDNKKIKHAFDKLTPMSGNRFRSWVHNNYLDVAKDFDLDIKGPHDNDFIRDVYAHVPSGSDTSLGMQWLESSRRFSARRN